MRRANVQLQADRRSEILEAAQACFARAGFHQTSMQEICAQAGMSPGNLYRYFRSKEDIIAGIAERDRAETAQQFAAVGQGDFFEGLAALAQHHLVERSMEEVALCAEIMTESRRNPAVARIYQDMETDVRARFIALLHSAADRGEIRRDIDFDGTVTVLFALGGRAVVAAGGRAVVQRRERDADRPRHRRANVEPWAGRAGQGRIES
jgi:AcrR family transcriptional regulator